MIKFLVDSSSDYTFKEASQKNIEFVPLSVTIEGHTYQSGINLDSDQFYNLLIKTKEFPKTSQPSPQQFVDVFLKAKEANDEIICVLLSSSLSGTYQSACLAKEIADYDKIYVVDSLSATHMISILVERGLELSRQNMPAEAIVAELNALKSKVKVAATVDTLEYLYMGGRLSKLGATIGGLANIKPVVSLNEQGFVYVKGKNIGMNKSINYLVNCLKNANVDPNFPIYSLYTFGTENPTKLETKLLENGLHFDKRVQVGSTIGAHVGPNAFGIMYVEK